MSWVSRDFFFCMCQIRISFVAVAVRQCPDISLGNQLFGGTFILRFFSNVLTFLWSKKNDIWWLRTQDWVEKTVVLESFYLILVYFQFFLQNRNSSTFVCIWQILSNYRLITRLKRLSRKLQINYVVSYFFYLYLVLHACAARFDVMGNVKNFVKYFGN